MPSSKGFSSLASQESRCKCIWCYFGASNSCRRTVLASEKMMHQAWSAFELHLKLFPLHRKFLLIKNPLSRFGVCRMVLRKKWDFFSKLHSSNCENFFSFVCSGVVKFQRLIYVHFIHWFQPRNEVILLNTKYTWLWNAPVKLKNANCACCGNYAICTRVHGLFAFMFIGRS